MLEKQKASKEDSSLTTMKNTPPAYRSTPAVDIYETDEALVLLADMPGIDEQGLQVEIAGGVLTLEGVPDEQDARPGYYRQFKLSERIDTESGEASLKDGVLTLKLPKSEAAKPKRIAVKTLH